MRIPCCLAVCLIALWNSAVFSADEPLKISVYATAETVGRCLGTPEVRKETIAVLKRFRVSKVYVEGNRIDTWVPVEMLREVRDDLVANGIEASGGVGPLPGKTFGVHVSGHQFWLDYGAKKTQEDLARAFTESGAVFDEMIVDDFYCFNEGTPEYRRETLLKLIDTAMWKPARSGSARLPPDYQDSTVVRPFPGLRLQPGGHDGQGRPHLDRHRNPQPGNARLRLRPADGGLCQLPLAIVGGGAKTGGAWFDSLDCTAQNFLDQAYQSVLAGAREITIFNLGSLVRGHPGHVLFQAALPKLFELAEKVRGRPATGIAYYKPSGSDGEENLYLMEYLPMVGLPIVPVAKFPAGWPVIFLGSQAAADKDLLASMKRELAQGTTLVVTPALLRRIDPEAAEMAGVTVAPD